jgi:hypothetical protein
LIADFLDPGNETEKKSFPTTHFSDFDIQYILLRDFLRFEVDDLRLDRVVEPPFRILTI